MLAIALIYWISYAVCMVLWLTGAAFVGVSGWVFFWTAIIPGGTVFLIACVFFLIALLMSTGVTFK